MGFFKNEFKDIVITGQKHVSQSLCSLAFLGLSFTDFIKCQLSAVLPDIEENIIAKQDTVLDCNKLSFL